MAATAYGTLVSLMHIIDQLQHHPSPPIALDKPQVQSLTQNITFLQECLEGYDFHGDSKETDDLASCIVKTAYAAEDVIESYIVENIRLAAPRSYDDEVIRWTIFYEDLEKVIKEMDSIKKVAMEMATEKAAVQDIKQRRANVFPGSASTGLNNDMMVGFDEVLLETMEKLIAQEGARRVIPVVGMGGIGKTTLAKNLYSKRIVQEHFDICAWVTISQQFNTKEILCDVLSQAKKENREQFAKMSESDVQLAVYQYLKGRRFLVVMDDMWSLDSWNEINHFFPDNSNGSRVLVTTRLSKLGSQLDSNNGIEMKFLGEDDGWILFSRTVFGEKTFPHELVEIGKKILGSCKGLPLSIVVIGGLLRNLEHTQECWESIKKKLNSIVNLENDGYCLKILKMSYNHLPVHLKPCFLYMGVFEEDIEIRVTILLRLWISEGFLKPQSGKSLETTAEEYLKDLVGRNLLLVHKFTSGGNIKYCKIHDLLRDFCMREAQNEKFYYNVIEPHSYPAIHQERRFVIPKRTSKEKLLDASQAMSHARSLTFHRENARLKPSSGLLRSLHAIGIKKSTFRDSLHYDVFELDDVFELVNLQYLAVGVAKNSKLPCSINLLWNLHTIIVDNWSEVNVPAEIWKMTQLRHVQIYPLAEHFPDPPSGNDDIVIMENLQSLIGVRNFKCSKEVVKRIPNIKKLRVEYYREYYGDERIKPYYCLNNLESLHKLESFYLDCINTKVDCIDSLTFPQSIQKLTLTGLYFDCEKVLEKIGSLPLLWKLVLLHGTFKTGKWKTVEGEFHSLRFLKLSSCKNLKQWEMADCSHFPRLEHLVLEGSEELEIPSEIGEIPTLRLVKLRYSSTSAVLSMKRIVEEQEYLQGQQQLSFHVKVVLDKGQEALQSLAAPNFEVDSSVFSYKKNKSVCNCMNQQSSESFFICNGMQGMRKKSIMQRISSASLSHIGKRNTVCRKCSLYSHCNKFW